MPESCKLYITAKPATAPASGGVVREDGVGPQRTPEATADQEPDVVALDHEFAATPRGLALIERLRGDPLVTRAEIVVMLADGSQYRYSDGSPPAPLRCPEAVLRPTSEDGKTRRAPRVSIRDGVRILVDNEETLLVNLSIVGAQVLSRTALRPGLPARVLLLDGADAPVKVNGMIAWAKFELPGDGSKPLYRAGIAFTDPDPVAVLRYCGRYRA